MQEFFASVTVHDSPNFDRSLALLDYSYQDVPTRERNIILDHMALSINSELIIN